MVKGEKNKAKHFAIGNASPCMPKRSDDYLAESGVAAAFC